MRDFIEGLTAWLTGWKTILLKRQLMVVAMFPFMISFVCAVGVTWLIWVYYPIGFAKLTSSFAAMMPKVLFDLLYYPMLFVIGLVIYVTIIYAVYIFHAIVAMPFYSLLAERTLQMHGKGPEKFTSWRQWSRHLVTMLRVSVAKGAVLVFLGAILFVASFVPVLNAVAVAITLLLLAFDCFDYSLEAKRMLLRQRVRYVLRHKAQWAGMALGLALTLLLPGLTLLVIPGAVCGAALILKETNESRVTAQENR
jgi:CysZ protein